MSTLPTGTVTFLFTDVEGSSQLWEQFPQAMPAALARHDALLRQVIQAHSGVIFKTVGDGVHAAFASAPAALHAALAIQRALAEETWGETGALRIRIALHTGVAEERDGDYFGPPLNRVARLMAAGHGGQLLLTRATQELVCDILPADVALRDLGIHHLKDLTRPEHIFQVSALTYPTDFPLLRTPDTQPNPLPAPQIPLLTTKLFVPAPAARLVPRVQLLERLNEGMRRKLTLIAAPAGFGKTTLLSAWSHQRRPAVAWVSLDESDNDPTRFWAYVLAAVETLSPGSAERARLLLAPSPQSPAVEVMLAALINDLAALSDEVAVVLDDYHLIAAQPIHDGLVFLLDHLPAHLHLIIATRADPPLPLARLRARAELSELRAAELRFTADEAAAFLNQVMGLGLSADAIAALEARTEGWIAGLQLAALSLQGRTDSAQFIEAFSGSHRYILDYLAEEVLGRQPAHLKTFLLQTAILDRLSGPLCDAVLLDRTKNQEPRTGNGVPGSRSSVLGSSDSYSRLVLDELERANLFLIPLDEERQWYRYHQLFADMLRSRLQQEQPELLLELHRRASAWYEQHGPADAAVEHALVAGDFQLAARLIKTNTVTVPVLLRGEVATLLRWLQALPADVVRDQPHLGLSQAWALLVNGQVDAVEPQLQTVEQRLQAQLPTIEVQDGLGVVAAIRATVAATLGDLPRASELAQQALASLRPDNMRVRSVVAVIEGDTAWQRGDIRAAQQAYTEASQLGRAAANLTIVQMALHGLAQVQLIQGQLRAAAAIYRHALELATEPAGRRLPAAMALIGLGELLREWNDLDGALQHVREGIELATQGGNASSLLRGHLSLARVYQALGDAQRANATIAQAESIAQSFGGPCPAQVAASQTRLWLAQRNLAAASQWAAAHQAALIGDMAKQREDVSPLSPLREFELITLARVYLAQGRPEEAGRLLVQRLPAAEAAGWMHSVIEILTLQAVALQLQGSTTVALTALARALALAEPEGYVRLFVDAGTPLLGVLMQIRAAQPHGSLAVVRAVSPSYLETLLAACDGATPPRNEVAPVPLAQPLAEPLSERELEVLGLLAAGRSNREIAQRLVVALGTVKRHTNNLYGKLAVGSRTQAVAKARALHLLEP